uniref:Uncharacterized protein n=1 Tax=Anguilla anguilla TaxID=7936 RepID=A0A0E9VQL7_ANGAN
MQPGIGHFPLTPNWRYCPGIHISVESTIILIGHLLLCNTGSK